MDSISKTRREFLSTLGRSAALVSLGGVLGHLLAQGSSSASSAPLWQIDPTKCIQCGKCATECVLNPSAVRCFHVFAICGYCDLCTGFFHTDAPALNTGAENQLCPTAAIQRSFVEDPYFQYVINRELCIACGKCVRGCFAYGNGSLHLQIDQQLCRHCNSCSIAAACPAQAISRVSFDKTYIPPIVKGA